MASSSSDAGAGNSVAEVRAKLRTLKQGLEDNRGEYTGTNSSKLTEVLEETNGLYDVSKTDSRAGALDATILNKTSALGAEQAGNLDKATPDKYVRRLLAKYGYQNGRGPVKWTTLAREVNEAGIHQHVPATTFLLGKYEAPKRKERQERKRKDHTPTEPMETADQVNVSQLQEVEEDKAQVARMLVLGNAIKTAADSEEAAGRPRRVNLFHMLLHPTSFSQTVENFFDLAFLLKDGFVQLIATADAAYLVDRDPHKEATATEFAAGLCKVQNILKLDFPTYRRLVERWCTSDAPRYLPARGSASGGGEGAGAGGSGRSKQARAS